jgi:stage V sporulation protein AC
MNMTPEQYNAYVRRMSPRSKLGRDMLRAFFVGGAICLLGQALLELYAFLGAPEEDAAAWCSITLIFLSALATGLGVYDELARFAGAGTLVPITGFANSVVSPALEFRTEGLIAGLAAKIFTVAGPVIVYGMLAGAAYGLICWLSSLA